MGAEAESHATPGDLAAVADVTVRGSLVSLGPGRVFYAGAEDDVPATVATRLVFQVDTVLARGAGDAAKEIVEGSVLLVEVLVPETVSIEKLAAETPAGLGGILFLSDYSSPEVGRIDYPDGAGADDVVYAPYGDGLWFEAVPGQDEPVLGSMEMPELSAAWIEATRSLDELAAAVAA